MEKVSLVLSALRIQILERYVEKQGCGVPGVLTLVLCVLNSMYSHGLALQHN